MDPYEPRLSVSETADGVRVALAGLAHGEGATLQQAADDLVARLLSWAVALRASGMQFGRGYGAVDLGALGFLHELAESAARGEDIRDLLFG